MKKLNTKGFGAIEAILTVLILAIVGGTGYYVYSQNQDKKVASVAQTNKVESDKQTKDQKFMLSDYVESYKIPENWEEDVECSSKVLHVAPPNSKEKYSCDSDGHGFSSHGVFMIYTSTPDTGLDIESCKSTKEKVKDWQGDPYDCEDIKIDGKSGLKLTYNSLIKYAGNSEVTSYILPINQKGSVLEVTYYRTTGDNPYSEEKQAADADYKETLKDFVNSFDLK